MLKFVRSFGRDQAGATAIEYAMIAALIAVTITGAVGLLGSNLQGVFQGVEAAIP